MESEIEVPGELLDRLRGRLLVVTGSGVSAESGIPTFRGRDGYWRSYDPMTLATPEAFARDPALVWEWYAERRARIRGARPNAGHEAIARLMAGARDALLVTQNVDDLHERAGTPLDRLVHIHGEILVSRCTRCAFETRDDVDACADEGASEPLASSVHASQVRASRVGAPDPRAPQTTLPRCPSCNALLRPGVVWFGEALDPRNIARIEDFFTTPIDLVIAAGTTATFPYIVDWATRGGALVEINPEESGTTPWARWRFRAPAARVLPLLVSRSHPG
jgi:NAD-dependent deacetylase